MTYIHPHALIRKWTERQEEVRADYYARTACPCGAPRTDHHRHCDKCRGESRKTT